MTETVTSRNGVTIRLTDERWSHISEEHAELAGHKLDVLEAIADAERVLAGGAGELLALKKHRMAKPLWPCIVSTQMTGSSSPRSSPGGKRR